MKYIIIKGLAEPVSELIIGSGWFTSEKKEYIDQLLADYIKAGGNMIDTGRFYSGGKAEGFLREWIKENPELRSKVMFTSKCCHHYVDKNNVQYPENNRVCPANITEDLEFSLKDLGVNKFEIYMLHRDNLEVPVAPLMDCLEKHRLEGKIVIYGVSNWTIDRIIEAQAYCKEKGYQGISVNSPSYSLTSVTTPRWVGTIYATDEYARWNTENDIVILSWGSQGSGFFGNYPFDGKKPNEDFTKAFFVDKNEQKLYRCKKLAAEKGYSIEPINIALAYVLCQNLKIAAIIGPRNSKELSSTLKTEHIILTSEEIEYLSLRSDKV